MESDQDPSIDQHAGRVESSDDANSRDLAKNSLPPSTNSGISDLKGAVVLDQVLKAFKAQLDLQQDQIKLLQGLTTSHQDQARQADKPSDNEAVVPTKINFTDEDFARALQWEERRSPESKEIEEVGKVLLEFCESKKALWFSDLSLDQKNAKHLSNILRRDLLLSLGSVTNSEITWDLTDQDQSRWPEREHELFIMATRFKYKEGGGMSQSTHLTKSRRVTFESSSPVGTSDAGPTAPPESPNLTDILRSKLDLDLSSNSLSRKSVAFLLMNQLGNMLPSDHNLLRLRTSLSLRMINAYLYPWRPEHKLWVRHPYRSEYEQMFAIRFFARVGGQKPKARVNNSTIPGGVFVTDTRLSAVREFGPFFEPKEMFLTEKRLVIKVISQYGTNTPCFNVLLLGDDLPDLADPVLEGENDHGGQLVAMHAFLQVLTHELMGVCGSWSKVLDGLDEKLGATVTDLLDEAIGHQLMFDDNHFKRSKLYFTSQQLCRAFKKYIEEALVNLEEMQENFFRIWNPRAEDLEFEDDLKVLSVYWIEAMAKPKASFQSLLIRVKNKQEEVESLRDGLFNATSVREASRGTEIAEISVRQNQYLFVFTIMTVIYLPLGFVTSVFGMHLFDTSDSGVVAAQPKFYITLVVLSVSTYIAAGLAFWLVRNNKKNVSTEGVVLEKKIEKRHGNEVNIGAEMDKGEGNNEDGIFASIRKRKGKGKKKGREKEPTTVVEDV